MLPGSVKLVSAWGIPVRLHITVPLVFVLLMVRFGYMGIPLGILLYGSVLMHELGHAMVARRYGIPTAAIDLHLLGGMALMTAPARSPGQEAHVAAAGPAVSVLLGVAFFALAAVTGGGLPWSAPRFADLFAYGAAINLGMAAFNMVPALPMDGGRIFRAVLSVRMGHAKATRVAAWVSRGFAALFVVLGLSFAVWSLVLVGVMLFFLIGYEQLTARANGASERAGSGPWAEGPGSYRPVVEIVPVAGLESREEFVDRAGRRYVVVTRAVRRPADRSDPADRLTG